MGVIYVVSFGPKVYHKSIKIQNRSHFYIMRSVFKPWVTYFCKIFEKVRKYSLRTPEIKKKIKKISLKTPIIKKKNKKKIGSNAKNLRKVEPQPEQTFLIKKNKCIAFLSSLILMLK